MSDSDTKVPVQGVLSDALQPRPKASWRVWCCKSALHAQPCWHGRCSCGWATAFDFTEEDVREMLNDHECSYGYGETDGRGE